MSCLKEELTIDFVIKAVFTQNTNFVLYDTKFCRMTQIERILYHKFCCTTCTNSVVQQKFCVVPHKTHVSCKPTFLKS
jgi:hypothetical protein